MDNHRDGFLKEFFCIVGMIVIALILSAIFWLVMEWCILNIPKKSPTSIGAKPAEAVEITPQPVVDIETKWNRLLNQYLNINNTPNTLPILNSEDEKAEVSSDDKRVKTEKIVETFILQINPKVTTQKADILSKAIVKYSAEYKLPIGLVLGVAFAESTFKMDAQGPLCKGGHRAVGAMQVMWPTHSRLASTLGVRSKHDMFGSLGVKVGCHLLSLYVKDAGSISGGLKQYLAVLSKSYILDKVFIVWMTIEQAETGLISKEEMKQVFQREQSYMRQMTRK